MGAAADAGIFAVSAVLFLVYHFWIFFFQGFFQFSRKHHFLLWSTSYQARDVWTRDIVADVRDALQTYGVQNLRNAITAASFMATTCGLIAIQGLLAIMLDSTRLDRVKEFSDNDPIAKGTWLQPALKLAITEGMVLLAFLWFMQSIRLMVHLGFLMRVVPSARNTENYFQEEAAVGVALRSSICFTAGLRTFYAFIPLVMWMFGATALLISTVVELLVLYLTDDIPRYPKARKPKTAAEIRQALRRVRTPAEVEAGIQLPFTHNPQPSTQGNAHDQDGVAVGSD